MAQTQDEIDLNEAYVMGFDDARAQRPPRPEKNKNEQFYTIGYEDGERP